MDGLAVSGNGEGIVLVAAVGVPDEVRADPSLVGVTGLAVCVHSYEHHIVIGVALIKAAGLDAEIDQRTVDPSVAQIFDGVSGIAVGLKSSTFSFGAVMVGAKVGGAADRLPMMVSTACRKGISLTLMR